MVNIRKTFRLAAILSGTLVAAAQSSDIESPAQAQLQEAYLQVVDAECLVADGLWTNAAARYATAQQTFESLQHDYPGWQGTQVERRIADCRNQIARLLQPHTEIATPPPSPNAGPVAVAPADPAATRRAQLLEELRQMRSMLISSNTSLAGPRGPQQAADSNSTGRAAAESALLRKNLIEQGRANETLRKEKAVLERKLVAMEKMAASSPPAPPLPSLSPVRPAAQVDLLAQLVRNEARSIQQRGDTEQAITLLTEAQALMPTDLSFRLLLGNAYCQTTRYVEAIALLRDVPESSTNTVEVHLLRGSAYMGLGQLGAARREMEAALKRQPGSSTAHYNLAQILFRLRPPDLEEAERHYRLALANGGDRDNAFETALRTAQIDSKLKETKTKKKKVSSPSAAAVPPNSPIPLPVASPVP